MSLSKIFLAAALAAAVASLAPVAAAAQTNDIIVNLEVESAPNTNTSNCEFSTDRLQVIPGSPTKVNVVGDFKQGSDCGFGGTPPTSGPAQITMSGPSNVTLDQGDSVPDSILFHWSATADACQFSGSSLNGAQVPNWKEAGYACVGAAACADPNSLDPEHNISYTFANAGIYKFQLTCFSGWSNGQPDTVSEIKTVTVQGSQPPVGSCTGPAGTSRQTTVTIADVGSYPIFPNVADVDTWADVFGLGWRPGGAARHWPGVQAAGAKLSIKNNHFVSLRFTVPADMQIATAANGYKPRGSFTTSASDTTPMTTWAITITEECGDFDVAAAPPSRQACYDEFSFPPGVPGTTWMVRSPSNPYQGACNLTPGETYYVNIMPASLSNPSNGLCTQGTCKVNLTSRGVFDNGAECTPQTCD